MKNNDIRIRNLEIFSSNYEGEGIEKMLPKGLDKKVGEISEGGTGQKGGIMIIKPPPLRNAPTSRHDRTRLLRAHLGHSPVHQGDAIIEINNVNSQPVVQLFVVRQGDSDTKVETGLQ